MGDIKTGEMILGKGKKYATPTRSEAANVAVAAAAAADRSGNFQWDSKWENSRGVSRKIYRAVIKCEPLLFSYGTPDIEGDLLFFQRNND